MLVMITQIMTFLAMYSLFRGMKGFLIHKKGKKTYDIMKGAEPIFYKKGRKGVLMVHGFTSSPSDLKDLSKYLADKGITVSAPLLAGHGTSPYNLAVTSWKDLISSIEKALNELKKEVDKVYIGGISAGGSIALAIAGKQHVDGIISLGTPIYFRRQHFFKIFFPFLRMFKPFLRKWYRSHIDKEMQKTRVGYDLIPLNSMSKITALVEESRKALPKITAPSLIMQSTEDFGVDNKTVDYLYKNLASMKKKVVWVKDAYHVLVVDKNREDTFKEIYNFVKEN